MKKISIFLILFFSKLQAVEHSNNFVLEWGWFDKKTIIIDYVKYIFNSKKKVETYLKENPEIYKLKEELLMFVKQNLTTETSAKNLINIINNE